MYGAGGETDAACSEKPFAVRRNGLPLITQGGFTCARVGQGHILQRSDAPSLVLPDQHRENQRIHHMRPAGCAAPADKRLQK